MKNNVFSFFISVGGGGIIGDFPAQCCHKTLSVLQRTSGSEFKTDELKWKSLSHQVLCLCTVLPTISGLELKLSFYILYFTSKRTLKSNIWIQIQKFIQDGIFFEFEDRKYCQHDFQILFAARCGKCSEFIVGRVIKALSNAWHPNCLTCHRCDKPVSDVGFTKVGDKVVCKDCAGILRDEINSGLGRVCKRWSTKIEGEPLRFQGDVYHPYHFNCADCGVELTSTAREVRSRLGITANKVVISIVVYINI